MFEAILWSVGISIGIIVFVGIPYIKGISQSNNSQCMNKQDYVMENLDKFGVKDNGTSLDEKNIYLVSTKRMGV